MTNFETSINKLKHKIEILKDALEDIKQYKENNDFVSLDTILKLLLDIDKNGNEIGIGKPEKLYKEAKFIGWYSRRIS
jgi:Txe/YoeB family toxin of Txe-Axe toxin-antitoxin module